MRVKFILPIIKDTFTYRTIFKQWNRLPRQVV